MDAFDKFWFIVKRFFFPVLLILAGLTFIIVGASQSAASKVLVLAGEDPSNTLTQTAYFMYGAVALFVLGLVSLYFVIEKKIPTFLLLGLSIVLIIGVYGFTQFNYNSIAERIKYETEVKESIALAKQGLIDIQKLQEAHEKKYESFATTFDSLKRFAETDSISVLVEATGDIPTRAMTMDEAKQLGLKNPKEVFTEEDAVKLGIIVRRYEKVPVYDYLFKSEKALKEERLYPFDLATIDVLRTLNEKTSYYKIESNEIDSASYGVRIMAVPPYGPQVANDIEDTLQVGSLSEQKMNTNWK